MIREYLNACDAWFISWGIRDSWIICFRSLKPHFPELFPTITDSKRPEMCLRESLASMAFLSRSIIRTLQVIIFDILRSRSCNSQWPLRSALVMFIYCCLQLSWWRQSLGQYSFWKISESSTVHHHRCTSSSSFVPIDQYFYERSSAAILLCLWPRSPVAGFSLHAHQTRPLFALGLGKFYYKNTIVIYSNGVA